MIINRRKPTGFATVFALVSLMLVGVTIGCLTIRVGMQARRTEHELLRAQQDQIRIARLFTGGTNEMIVPHELSLEMK